MCAFALDIMVVFDIVPGSRGNYKIWEEGQVPKLIMEITSQENKENDYIVKKSLYEELGVEEYWLFDPKQEWVPDQLIGYRLQEGVYHQIRDSRSEVLQLQLVPKDSSLNFYRLDNGVKLLTPDELFQIWEAKTLARKKAEQAKTIHQETEKIAKRILELEAMLDRYRTQFGDLPS